MTPIHPQLRALLTELDSVNARAKHVSGESPDTILLERPSEGAWSITKCFEHLNMTTLGYLRIIDKALKEGQRTDVPASTHYRRDFIGWILSQVMEPPSRIKMKTRSSDAIFVGSGKSPACIFRNVMRNSEFEEREIQ